VEQTPGTQQAQQLAGQRSLAHLELHLALVDSNKK
jgi:hypothetical protein